MKELNIEQNFMQMKKIVMTYNKLSNQKVKPSKYLVSFKPFSLNQPLESDSLHNEQSILSDILENSANIHTAKNAITNSILKQTSWKIEQWPDDMLETARLIAQKWKNGVV